MLLCLILRTAADGKLMCARANEPVVSLASLAGVAR